jgi:Phage capsid protein
LLRPTTVQEAVIKGNTAVFLVSGSGGAVAVTRGVSGLIPYGVISNTQNSCTLVENHAPFEKTSFNIFASQGDQKRAMQMASIAVMNRAIDLAILAQLDTATHNTGAAQQASLRLVNIGISTLSNNGVQIWEEDNMFGVISGGFRSYLTENTEFSSGQYVDVKPLVGPVRKMWRWNGVNWMINPSVTGVATSTEKCYVYHRNAIGFAANTKEMDVVN